MKIQNCVYAERDKYGVIIGSVIGAKLRESKNRHILSPSEIRQWEDHLEELRSLHHRMDAFKDLLVPE